MHLDGIDHACKVHPSSAFVDRNQSLIGSVVFGALFLQQTFGFDTMKINGVGVIAGGVAALQ